MEGLITTLTDIATTVFESNSVPTRSTDAFSWGFEKDPVLIESQLYSSIRDTSPLTNKKLRDYIFNDEVIQRILSEQDQLDYMILTPLGGIRISYDAIIYNLFSSAFLSMYFLNLPKTKEMYAKTVIEGLDQLKNSIINSFVEITQVSGIAKVLLTPEKEIKTTWGLLKSVKPLERINEHYFGERPITRCFFIEKHKVPVVFDNSPDPKTSFTPIVLDRINDLFPLACALGSSDYYKPAVPIVTWNTHFLPFMPGNTFSVYPSFQSNSEEMDISRNADDIEEWSRIIHKANTRNIEVAIKRICTAVSKRSDFSDSLIDAVMAWENLLGTNNEVTFRVCASLAKLIKKDILGRLEAKKRYAQIYDLRSRLVHGVDATQNDIRQSSTEAIAVALEALSILLKREKEWLVMKSNERSDRILIE